MKYLRIAAILTAAVLAARAQDPEANVNERYTVESVEVTGIDQAKLSPDVRENIHGLVGQRFSQVKLDDLARLIRRALPGGIVSIRVSRGEQPDHVKVIIEIRQRQQRFDLAAPKAVYHSRQGFSAEVDGSVKVHTSTFTFGVLSDGDSLVERAAGLRARYENSKVGTSRVRLAFEFDSLHTLWNRATLDAIDGTPEVYRTRQNFEPVVTITVARPVKISFGTSFQRYQTQFPAAHTEASNAVITTLRYDRLLEESGPNKHRIEAGYNLRAATTALASDRAYARHTFEFRYSLWHGGHRLSTHFTSGIVGAAAPMFDRFVLGNSTTLRGWNKYDLAPAGGDRVVHNSVEYRYRAFDMFYDTGAVWNSGQPVVARHSAGAGLHFGELALLVAFPIRNGRAEPVFIAGLNL